MRNQLVSKSDKRLNAIQRITLVDNMFEDEDIRKALKQYLEFRRQYGLSVEQWKKILDELLTFSNDKNIILKIIDKSYMNSWKKFYPISNSFNSNVVQNYNTNYKPTTTQQRLNEFNNSVARDISGNPLTY